MRNSAFIAGLVTAVLVAGLVGFFVGRSAGGDTTLRYDLVTVTANTADDSSVCFDNPEIECAQPALVQGEEVPRKGTTVCAGTVVVGTQLQDRRLVEVQPANACD